MSIKEMENREYCEEVFAKEQELYRAINQAKKATWRARMLSVEIGEEYKDIYHSPIYEAYNTIQCAYELLETAKVLAMVHYTDLAKKEEG